jgi:hypothetical protein
MHSVTQRVRQSCGREKGEPAYAGPPEYDSPKDSVMIAYFFLDDFLALDAFFAGAAFFFAAISAHHLSCLTGPPGRASWHNTPDLSDFR